MMPQRIQRKRTKGWRMPEGAVYVGRPSVWGNPFSHTQRFYGLEHALVLYRNMVSGVWDPSIVSHHANPSIPYSDATAWTKRLGWSHPLEAIRSNLRGRDLACWCPLDQPCHADVLLELANRVPPQETDYE